ncbi:MAG: hypothetical protein C0522_05125 [Rhodocyclaceae bacterium]|jgi:hypothetical protein|nr:hypothetical protein [Rhodocyclaceae bacterium]
MKRLFFVLLMLILPLQAVWAAAGVYCQHEQGQAASHFGHHGHQHKASPDKHEQGNPGGKADSDCGYHHASDSKTVLASVDAVVADTSMQFSYFHLPRYSHRAPDKPERPKWPAAA